MDSPRSILKGDPDERLSPEDDSLAPPPTLWIVFGALIATIVVYNVIATWLAAQGPPPKPPAELSTFTYVLAAVAAATLGAIPIVRRVLMPPSTWRGGGGTVTRRRAGQILGRYFTASIVSWALCEAVAIYGLQLSFLSHDPIYVRAFSPVAVIAMALLAPRAETVRAMYRAAADEP